MYGHHLELHQLKASTAMDLGSKILPISARRGLGKLGLVHKSVWSVDCLRRCWGHSLAVGRQKQSESIWVAIDFIWWTVLTWVVTIPREVSYKNYGSLLRIGGDGATSAHIFGYIRVRLVAAVRQYVLSVLSSHLLWTSGPWTYQPPGVTQDFSTFLLRGLPSFFSREGFSRFFPSSTVMSNFVY